MTAVHILPNKRSAHELNNISRISHAKSVLLGYAKEASNKTKLP
jgi:hypothetical protein